MVRCDITIIGAGLIGLSIAAQLADKGKEVYVLEQNKTYGLEISSRHSGVIHSGIYYPEGSLKACLCVRGNQMLYGLCEQHDIACKRLGKLIVASNNEEMEQLQTLLERGFRNGVSDLKMLSKREIAQLEPNVKGLAAILSPSTGIIDSQGLMRYLATKIGHLDSQILFRTKVVGIEKITDGYQVVVEDYTGKSTFATRILINCAGLYCDSIAKLAGIDINQAKYKLHYCKGEYFSAGSRNSKLVNRLIYPVPPPGLTGVGIHTTFDMDGRMRFGPGIEYVTEIDYSVDSRNKDMFCRTVMSYLPSLECEDVEPEMSGIRPKLQELGGNVRDFVIREESDKGFPGLINLIGIESPGLTASPAIAEYVSGLIQQGPARR